MNESDNEDKEDSEAIEEGLEAKVMSKPSDPTQDEIDRHMATHIPFRSWCPHCVAGKAKNNRHRRREESENEVPVISIDYMFMGEGKEDAEAEEGKGKEEKKSRKEIGMPILVMKDRKSKAVYASVVPEKGKCPYAIKRLSRDISQFGYNRLIIKSDQEAAIMDLKDRVKRERQE